VNVAVFLSNVQTSPLSVRLFRPLGESAAG
jgi:hypothetical protein